MYFQGAYEANFLYNKLAFYTLTVCFLSLSLSLSLSRPRVRQRGLCKDDCERLCWNLAGPLLGEAPHAVTPIQRSSALWGWEVSLSRALNGSTKLITSPSEFLKGPGSHAGVRETGATLQSYSDRANQAGRPHKKQSVPRSRQEFGGKRTP